MVCVLRRLPKNAKALDDNPLLEQGAKMAGLRIYRTPSGKVILGFPDQTFNSYDSAIDADRAIRNVLSSFKKGTNILRQTAKDATKGAGAPVPADIPIEDILPEIRADELIHKGRVVSLSDPASFPAINESLSRLDILTVRQRLRRLGKPGVELSEGWSRAEDLTDQIKGRFDALVEDVHLKATKVGIDTTKWGLYAEKKTGAKLLTPQQQAVFTEQNRRIVEETRKMLATGEAIGLDVKKQLDNYFPHTINFSQMTKENQEALINQMIEDGIASSRSQAFTILEHVSTNRDTIVSGTIDKIRRQTGVTISKEEAEILLARRNKGYKTLAGHIEKERYGIPGYTNDLRLAYLPAINSNAKRLATAQVWGARGDRLHSLINQLPPGQARKFAEQVKDLELGFGIDRLENGWRWLYDTQGGKLFFSALPNSQQWMNNFVPAGYGHTLNGFIRQMLDLKGGQQRAAVVGAIAENALADLREAGAAEILSTQPRNLIVKFLSAIDRKTLKPIRKIGLGVFKISEVFVNRSTSVRIGDLYFDDLVRVITNPKSTAKQLKRADLAFREFGLTSEAVLKSKSSLGGNDPDLIEAMRGIFSQKLSNKTQGKFGVQNLPIWAHSKWGQTALHFKKFPFFQAKFMIDSLKGGPRKDWRVTLRTLTVLGAYAGTGYGLTELRSKILGRPTAAKKIIDDFLDDDTVQGNLIAAIVMLSQAGAVGILGDIAFTAMQGGSFNILQFLLRTIAPPEVSSISNYSSAVRDIGAGILKGGDIEEFKAAGRSLSGEFGIAGRGFTEKTIPKKKTRKKSKGSLRGLGGLGGLKGL